MDKLLIVVVLAVVAGVAWRFARPSAVFVVQIRAGRPTTSRGRITEAFRIVVAEVFAEFALSTGEIRGVPRGRRIALWFSSNIPPAACQRLRNWWLLSGWPARSGRG
jgi:hypothetical protein